MPVTLTLRVTTPPPVTPITLDHAKRHLRVDHDDDDDLIEGYIWAATAWAERYVGRALITTGFQQAIGDQPYANAWPMTPSPLLILPLAFSWPPLQSMPYRLLRAPNAAITSITLIDPTDGSSVAITPDQYAFDAASEPSRFWLNNTAPLQRRQSLIVSFTAGYGATDALVPRDIKLAVAMLTAYFYENRGDMDMSAMPAAAECLLANHRLVWLGG